MKYDPGWRRTREHLISIVIPVMDEGPNIRPLASRIEESLDAHSLPWECIWVDDGSSDDTFEELVRLRGRSNRHSYVRLDRSYGQSAAMAVGFQNARGHVIVTLDGDGQNPPEEIPGLVERLLRNDFDMVCGYRIKRYRFKRLIASRIANGFRNFVTPDKIRDVGCSLRAFRAECVDGLFLFRGMHRFLPTLVRLNGYDRIVEVPVSHSPRRLGRSKYGLNDRLWVGIVDTIAVRWMCKRKVVPRVHISSPAAKSSRAALGEAKRSNGISQEITG